MNAKIDEKTCKNKYKDVLWFIDREYRITISANYFVALKQVAGSDVLGRFASKSFFF